MAERSWASDFFIQEVLRIDKTYKRAENNWNQNLRRAIGKRTDRVLNNVDEIDHEHDEAHTSKEINGLNSNHLDRDSVMKFVTMKRMKMENLT